jgi:cytochrome c oxidase subunit 2
MTGGTMPEARRHFLTALVLWAVLSLAGIVAILLAAHILPLDASHEASIIDRTFVVLTVVSVPVLMLVVVGLVYSAWRFRAASEDEEGPPIRGHRPFEISWLVVTFLLVCFLAAYGAVGLVEIRGAQEADLHVQASAMQWQWQFQYPDLGITSPELVLPVNERAYVTIVSSDVVHSFFVPAFGVKQDAVPGRVTHLYVTPTEVGNYGVQCAELCGLGHTRMTANVVVMTAADFQTWVAQQRAAQASASPSAKP